MLYIVPTPIGNLKDITLRALEVLKSSDYLLCEDTRTTKSLLRHLEIENKCISFHMHNEAQMEEKVLNDLEEGKTIALVSDAGTPGVSDPGIALIGACHKRGLKVNSLPGPSSVTASFALAGLEATRFQFLGFFPKKEGEKKALIEELLEYDGVSIFFESPRRILKTIALFPSDCTICVAKEISKIHEKLITLIPEEAKDYEEALSRGEMCVLVKGKGKEKAALNFEDTFLLETLYKYVSKRDAAKIAAELTGKKKQHFYSL